MVRNYTVFVVLLSVLFSCRKERSFESPNGIPSATPQWQFKEAGSVFAGPMDTAFLQVAGLANSLNLTGLTTDGRGRISLQVIAPGSIIKGDYKNPRVLFQYSQGGTVIYQSSPDQASDFTITITSIDSISVAGTFMGTAVDTIGNKQIISEGKFTAAIGATAPVLTGRGQLTVWSKQLCSGNGNIFIKAGDSTSAITQAVATQPFCGQAGTATFNLPAGAYSVIAACGTDTLVLNASVLPNVCSTLEVDFSQLANRDYFPLSSRWTYGNVADPQNDTLAIDSVGTSVINGQTYTSFLNERTAVTNYYRKKDGLYYQYLSSAFGQPLITPVEIIILKDNVPVNTSWQSDPYQIDYSNSGPTLILTVQLRSKIIKLNYTDSFNGKTYSNLIQVNSELYSKDANGNWQDAGTGYTTVFAKGIGIVFYQDLNALTDWGILNYNVSF